MADEPIVVPQDLIVGGSEPLRFPCCGIQFPAPTNMLPGSFPCPICGRRWAVYVESVTYMHVETNQEVTEHRTHWHPQHLTTKRQELDAAKETREKAAREILTLMAGYMRKLVNSYTVSSFQNPDDNMTLFEGKVRAKQITEMACYIREAFGITEHFPGDFFPGKLGPEGKQKNSVDVGD